MKPETTIDDSDSIINLLEAAIFISPQPLSLDKMQQTLFAQQQFSKTELRGYLKQLEQRYQQRGIELVERASGYQFQSCLQYSAQLEPLLREKPPRLGRALLETLTLIAYRQPITRSEIEAIRGVSVSSHIVHQLKDRGWIRQVGHRDVPGRPALFATTPQFLDYFGIQSLTELPELNPELVASLEAQHALVT